MITQEKKAITAEEQEGEGLRVRSLPLHNRHPAISDFSFYNYLFFVLFLGFFVVVCLRQGLTM